MEELVAAKPEDTNKPEPSQAASAPALNWGNSKNDSNSNNHNGTQDPWENSNNSGWGSNLFNDGEMGDPSGFFSEGNEQNHE